MNSTKILLACFLLFSGTVIWASTPEKTKKEIVPGAPEEVRTIIKNSCYGCHHTGSKNEKATEEFNFDKLEHLSKIKKISAYNKIHDTVEEGEMPPKKFIARYPDLKLSEQDKELLLEWARKTAEAQVKGM